jgi:predicted metal-dependent phosphoesterase TrpH
LLRADLHIHTMYSMDCASKPEQIIERCLKKNINCIAIADHGTTDGAFKLKSMSPFPVIIAEEILTPWGEIMGMFLTETIPTGIPVDEAIKRIKDQGGLVCIPHPGDRARSSAFSIGNLSTILDDIDIIEVFNARNHAHNGNGRALEVARKYQKLCGAGSDAHTPGEIGGVFIEMQEFNTLDEFKASLKEGKVTGKTASPFVHITSTASRFTKPFLKHDQ